MSGGRRQKVTGFPCDGGKRQHQQGWKELESRGKARARARACVCSHVCGGPASGLGTAAGSSHGVIPHVPAPSPCSLPGLVVPEELAGPGITSLPFLALRMDGEHRIPQGGPSDAAALAAEVPALGRVSPWSLCIPPHPPEYPPTSPWHSPVAIAPLPWHCCQGTIAREPPSSVTRAGSSGAPSHRPQSQVMAGRMGLWGAWHLLSPPQQGLGVPGWSLLSPLDGSEPPGQILSKLRDCSVGHPACFASLPGPGRFLASDLGMWRL